MDAAGTIQILTSGAAVESNRERLLVHWNRLKLSKPR